MDAHARKRAQRGDPASPARVPGPAPRSRRLVDLYPYVLQLAGAWGALRRPPGRVIPRAAVPRASPGITRRATAASTPGTRPSRPEQRSILSSSRHTGGSTSTASTGSYGPGAAPACGPRFGGGGSRADARRPGARGRSSAPRSMGDRGPLRRRPRRRREFDPGRRGAGVQALLPRARRASPRDLLPAPCRRPARLWRGPHIAPAAACPLAMGPMVGFKNRSALDRRPGGTRPAAPRSRRRRGAGPGAPCGWRRRGRPWPRACPGARPPPQGALGTNPDSAASGIDSSAPARPPTQRAAISHRPRRRGSALSAGTTAVRARVRRRETLKVRGRRSPRGASPGPARYAASPSPISPASNPTPRRPHRRRWPTPSRAGPQIPAPPPASRPCRGDPSSLEDPRAAGGRRSISP